MSFLLELDGIIPPTCLTAVEIFECFQLLKLESVKFPSTGASTVHNDLGSTLMMSLKDKKIHLYADILFYALFLTKMYVLYNMYIFTGLNSFNIVITI